MAKYGWYLDGEEQVRDTGDDVAEMIQDAVKEFTSSEEIIAEERGDSEDDLKQSISSFISKMRVGEMRELCADDLIDESDVIEADDDCSGPLTGNDICSMINSRILDELDEGSACVKKNSPKFPSRISGGSREFAAAVMQWARLSISFDPPTICRGTNPLPMCLVNGAWICGDKKHEDADISAYVVYTTQPCPETGHEGWGWWARGRMGEAASLKEAMSQAEAKLAQIAAKETAQ